MPSSGITVIEDGNRREGDMTKQEVEQCMHDIISWFKRKASDFDVHILPKNDIQRLEKTYSTELPMALQTLITKQNGGLWFNEYKQLSAEEMMEKASLCTSWDSWKEGYLPFAADPDDAMLVVDSTTNCVYALGEDGVCNKMASTLSSFLESYRDNLLSGNVEYVEDVGLVEKTRK